VGLKIAMKHGMVRRLKPYFAVGLYRCSVEISDCHSHTTSSGCCSYY